VALFRCHSKVRRFFFKKNGFFEKTGDFFEGDFFEVEGHSGLFLAQIEEPSTWNTEPGQVFKPRFVPSRTLEKKFDDVTKSSHLYQVPGKSSHFWKY